MHKCGVRREQTLCSSRKRRHARKHTVLVVRQFAQHDGHGGLVKVLDVVRCNAHAHRAAPVGNFRQLSAQVVKNVLRLRGVPVGDVQQRQCGRIGVVGQGHVGAQLRQHQRRRHGPLGVRGVTVGKKLHGHLHNFILSRWSCALF